MGMRKEVVAVSILIALVVGLGAAAQAANTKPVKPSIVEQAKAYCTSTGGVVELRNAVYGTNNPQQDWLWLTGK